MQGATCRHRPSRHPQGPTELARQHADLAPGQRREAGRGAGPPRRTVGARRQVRPHVGGHGCDVKSPRCTQVRNSTRGKAHARRPRSTWTTRATRPSSTRRAPSKQTRNAALRTRHPGTNGHKQYAGAHEKAGPEMNRTSGTRTSISKSKFRGAVHKGPAFGVLWRRKPT